MSESGCDYKVGDLVRIIDIGDAYWSEGGIAIVWDSGKNNRGVGLKVEPATTEEKEKEYATNY